MRHSNIFVISGPSGAGKGTLVARLLEDVPDTWLSISMTTRKPRGTERDGVNYHFVAQELFDDLLAEDGFLEWAVYSDASYGTPAAPVREQLQRGKQVLLEIDVQGAFQVLKSYPQAHLVFIEPPSMEELERRLRARGTEDEETIQKRLKTAVLELARKEEYDIRLVNDDLEQAVRELVAYVNEKAEEPRE
ncbi:MAG TPA: guanylate kinase [Eggerthellaceae bacterium]|nr:guanylate kinase [Eggerthellaceae bacterium]